MDSIGFPNTKDKQACSFAAARLFHKTLTQCDSLVPMATNEQGPWQITRITASGLRVFSFHWQQFCLVLTWVQVWMSSR